MQAQSSHHICIANRATVVLFAAILTMPAMPAVAHHSFSMFDNHKTMTLKGTVKAFDWTNPHSILWLYAQQPIGVQLWTLEMGSPGAMTRSGWTRRSLQPGDEVVVEIAPLRDGKHGGSLKKVTTPSGQVLTIEARANCRPELK